jgi:hypothetical protein
MGTQAGLHLRGRIDSGSAVEPAVTTVFGLARLPGFDHCLNVGGDITGRVGVTGSPPWRVAIEDPADKAPRPIHPPQRTP